MNKTILQIPLSKELKSTAEQEALAQGFSSLQEYVRVFLTKLAQKKIEVSIQEAVSLSEKSDKRYLKMTKDFEKGENSFHANDIKDFLNQLDENSLS
jgi:hypothetical protein